MIGCVERRRLLAGALVICAVLAASGCNKQKKTDEGKTYTPDTSVKQAPQGGGSSSGGGGSQSGGGGSQSGSSGSQSGGGQSGQSAARRLDAPADTTNGKASKASDAGSSDAIHGTAVAEPGAPVEHDPQPKSAPKAPSPNGHS